MIQRYDVFANPRGECFKSESGNGGMMLSKDVLKAMKPVDTKKALTSTEGYWERYIGEMKLKPGYIIIKKP